MLKKLLFVFCLVLLPVAAHASVTPGSADVVTSGLVGHWTFDGSQTNWSTGKTQDSSGNGNAAQLVSMSTTTSPTVGKLGQALKFNGTNQWAIANSVNTNSITVAAWIKTSATGPVRTIAARDDFFSNRVYQFRLDGSGHVEMIPFNSSGVNGDYIGSKVVTDGKWHFVVGTYDQTTTRVYVDGIQDGNGNTAVSGALKNVTSNTYIGVVQGDVGSFTFSSPFSGTIDDLRVYNRALSAAEVAQLYNSDGANAAHSNTTSLSSGLIGYWTLDGSQTNWSTGKTQDSSGNGNVAQLVSMSTTTSPTVGKLGQALQFMTTKSQYAVVTNPVNLGTAFTMSVWFKVTADTGDIQVIMANKPGGSTSGWAFFLNTYQTNDHTIHFEARNGGVEGAWTNTNVYQVGKWYQAAVVVSNSASGAIQGIYLNGKALPLAANTLAPSFDNTTAPDIGRTFSSPAFFFNGTMDDVRIYNRALSAAEVAQLYNSDGANAAHSNTTSLSSGLMGYWTLDGSQTNWATGVTQDSSGNGYNGSLLALSTTTSPVIGKVGQALKFNSSATGQMVNLGNVLDPTTSASWTYNVWVKPVSNGNDGYIFGKFDAGGASGVYLRALSGSWTGGYQAGGGGALTGPALANNKWTMITLVVVPGGIGSMYINGQYYTSGGMPAASVNSVNFTIGNRYDDARRFNGSIDDLRVYNRALSAQEVAQLYAMTK